MLNMNPREYCIWLQGYLEAAGNNLTETQVQTIKTRLDNIFEHVAEKPKAQPVEPVKSTVNTHHIQNGGEVFRC